MKNNYHDLLKNIEEKFTAKKFLFKEKIEKWKQKGSLSLYTKSSELFSSLSRGFEALKQQIEDETISEQSIRGRLKSLKKEYKQLNEMTKPIWRQWIEAIGLALFAAVILRNFLFSLYHVPTGSAEPNILVGDRLWGNKTAYFFDEVKRGDLAIFDNPEQGYDERNFFTYLWSKYVGFPIPLLGLKGGPINVVKRIIGIPGDVVEGKIENGKTAVYLNGEKLEETYVNQLPLIFTHKTTGFLPKWFPVQLPGLMKSKDIKRYTYDPSRPFDQQPYYQLRPDEIIRNPETNKPLLLEAYSPTVSNFGFSIDQFGPYTIPEGMYWAMGDSRKNSHDSRGWGFLSKKYIHGRASFIIYSIDSEEPLWLFELIKHPIQFWTKSVRWNRTFRVLT